MVGRKVHWLDTVAQELWDELHDGAQDVKDALSGDVPLGTVSMTEQEQLSKYMTMQPQELDALRQTVGDEQFQGYTTAMDALATKHLGPLKQLFEAMQ